MTEDFEAPLRNARRLIGQRLDFDLMRCRPSSSNRPSHVSSSRKVSEELDDSLDEEDTLASAVKPLERLTNDLRNRSRRPMHQVEPVRANAISGSIYSTPVSRLSENVPTPRLSSPCLSSHRSEIAHSKSAAEKVTRFREETVRRIALRRDKEKRELDLLVPLPVNDRFEKERALAESRRLALARARLSEVKKWEQLIEQEETAMVEERKKIDVLNKEIQALEHILIQSLENINQIDQINEIPHKQTITDDSPKQPDKKGPLLKAVDENLDNDSSSIAPLEASNISKKRSRIPVWKQPPIAIPDKDFYVNKLKKGLGLK